MTAGGPGAWLRRLVRRAPPLRPPGALEEEAFAARCIRCGRCAEVCAWHALRPAGAALGLEAGTPEVVPREAPCWLCLRCPPVCPTGALAPVAAVRDVRMGRARIVAERCFAHQGVLCRTCLDACPLQGEAIRQDAALRPVITERCVGCGLCEQRCPPDEPAIFVVPKGAAT